MDHVEARSYERQLARHPGVQSFLLRLRVCALFRLLRQAWPWLPASCALWFFPSLNRQAPFRAPLFGAVAPRSRGRTRRISRESIDAWGVGGRPVGDASRALPTRAGWVLSRCAWLDIALEFIASSLSFRLTRIRRPKYTHSPVHRAPALRALSALRRRWW